jgi:hypothetical protein
MERTRILTMTSELKFKRKPPGDDGNHDDLARYWTTSTKTGNSWQELEKCSSSFAHNF